VSGLTIEGLAIAYFETGDAFLNQLSVTRLHESEAKNLDFDCVHPPADKHSSLERRQVTSYNSFRPFTYEFNLVDLVVGRSSAGAYAAASSGEGGIWNCPYPRASVAGAAIRVWDWN
jgi:hypothetical protein